MYQTGQPMLSYLYDNLDSLLKNVYPTTVKTVVLDECATAYQIWKIDLKKDSNLLDNAKTNTGLFSATLIKKLKNKDEITQAESKQFYDKVK